MTATQERRDKIITDDLFYEIGMLRGCGQRLRMGIADDFSQNVVIESFWLHARNIIEFLDKRGTLFVEAGEFACDPALDTWSRKINGQITHLIHERALGDDEKLNRDDVNAALVLIETEIKRFAARLSPRYARLAAFGR